MTRLLAPLPSVTRPSGLLRTGVLRRTRLVRSLTQWPVRSQQHARRNAMVASTALTARRRETLEVDEFLAAYLRPLEPEDRAVLG